MTSGHFQSYPLSAITINRADRQRKELTGIKELSWSIQSCGLINPIIIDRSGVLIAGEQRLEAVRLLGHDNIMIQFVDELSNEERVILELEENIRRTALPWQDECEAVYRFHKLRLQIDPSWTLERTAQELHTSITAVQKRIEVAKELRAGNLKVSEAPYLSTAINMVARAADRRAAAERTALLTTTTAVVVPPIPLIQADFHEWQLDYSGSLFNFIHCDFPYGINADNQKQGANVATLGGYADSADVYWTLISTLKAAMSNVIAESAHLMFWFSMDYYYTTLHELRLMGWAVNPFPLIWHKSDNTGLLPDPARGPRRIYETCFLASRGDRKIVQAVGNVFAAPVTKISHMSEKSLPMLQHFMRMFVDDYTVGLDPTCGSGNAVKAMLKGGAKSALGLEKDENFLSVARENWDE